MKIINRLVLVVASLACGTAYDAAAAEAVGEAERVVNIVTGTGVMGNRRIEVSESVFRGETVTAAAGSRAELELLDGSRLLVDENATIALDDFVISENSFAEGTISISKGAFRLITGRSKGKIDIQTPLAHIGIRGSIVDVYVNEENTFVVNLAGVLRVCTAAGACQIMERSCDIVEIASPTEIEERPFLFSNQRSRAEEASTFHLTERQLRHGFRFRASTAGCSARSAAESREGRRNVDPGGPPEPRAEPATEPRGEPPAPSEPPGDDGCNGCESPVP